MGRNQLETLEKKLTEAWKSYWTLNQSVVSDPEYDRMVEELRALDPEHPFLEKVGPTPTGTKRITHKTPMLSLDKAYTDADLSAWFAKHPGARFIAAPKMDGMAISLVYGADGLLKYAATRGNGLVGEDITENLRGVEGIPAAPFYVPPGRDVELRGELVALTERVVDGGWDQHFSNSRNMVAGLARTVGPHPAKAALRLYIYDDRDAQSSVDPVQWDPEAFFFVEETPPWYTGARPLLPPFVEALRRGESTWDCACDGVVIRLADDKAYDEAGATAHHPKGAIAYKFDNVAATTKVVDVIWQISRNGTLTPVAELEPVHIGGAGDGVMVSRVSLHNLTVLDSLSRDAIFGPGSEVQVSRRGGVIPYIEAVLSHGDYQIKPPTTCPGCGGLAWAEGPLLQALHSDECLDIVLESAIHFAKTCELKGLGRSILLEVLQETTMNRPELGPHIHPIQLLWADELKLLDKFFVSDEARKNQYQVIKTAREELRPEMLLAGLGIPGVGVTVAKALVQHSANWVDLYTKLIFDFERLQAIPGIGQEKARSIRLWADHPRVPMARFLPSRSLLGAGAFRDSLAFQYQNNTNAGDEGGDIYVFTGTLRNMSRNEATVRLEAQGLGTVQDRVTAKTSYLVIPDEMALTTKKVQDAANKGVKVIRESFFMALLDAKM